MIIGTGATRLTQVTSYSGIVGLPLNTGQNAIYTNIIEGPIYAYDGDYYQFETPYTVLEFGIKDEEGTAPVLYYDGNEDALSVTGNGTWTGGGGTYAYEYQLLVDDVWVTQGITTSSILTPDSGDWRAKVYSLAGTHYFIYDTSTAFISNTVTVP